MEKKVSIQKDGIIKRTLTISKRTTFLHCMMSGNLLELIQDHIANEIYDARAFSFASQMLWRGRREAPTHHDLITL